MRPRTGLGRIGGDEWGSTRSSEDPEKTFVPLVVCETTGRGDLRRSSIPAETPNPRNPPSTDGSTDVPGEGGAGTVVQVVKGEGRWTRPDTERNG